jgi:cystathionine gamma-synthase
VLGGWGIGNTAVDMANLDAVAQAVAANKTRFVWVETPSNPLMKITDIEALAAVAHDAGVLLVVDNTFASPYLQNPLALGADVVVHSTTKYIGGIPTWWAAPWWSRMPNLRKRSALCSSPWARSPVRWMPSSPPAASKRWACGWTAQPQRPGGGGMAAGAPRSGGCAVPGLPSHPGHELAKKQMRGFGGMVSVQFKGGEAAARKVAESTSVFTLAESLGGIESLMNYPSEMTHASVKGTELAVPVNLLRLSCGIEDVEDLVADLEQAFSSIP